MLLSRFLARLITTGNLVVIGTDGRSRRFGDGSGDEIRVRIEDPALSARLLLDPFLAVPEAYLNGRIAFERGTVRSLFLLIAENCSDATDPGFGAAALEYLRRLRKRIDQWTPARAARARVAHHYDLDQGLYDLFLDRDRQYSCALFRTGQETLEEAQEAKKRLVAAKLCLSGGERVLEIGCGWGGLALHLARFHDARVVGITLSDTQARLARERVRAAGLQDRVEIRLADYRAVGGTFDRIVSVGMFEHVGINHYGDYFRRIRSLLAPDGVALVHSIGRSHGPGATNPFIAKYIFPGGYIPALSEVMPAIEASGLHLTDVEILRLHYAETLRHWSERFAANRARAAALYDERFCRMWETYLAGAEASFRNGRMMVFQAQLARRQDAVPLTRDYVLAAPPEPARQSVRLAGE